MAPPCRRDFLGTVGLALAFEAFPARSLAVSAADLASLPAGDPRDLPGKDLRLAVRTVDTPHLPQTFPSRAEWEARAARLREQILSSAGLWPMPERTPLRAEIFDRHEEEEFSVEKVYFESYPSFFCTGNLFRPRGANHKPPFPAVLCPHGHWNYGRLENNPGEGGVSSIPLRCANFALQGYVSFAYDMVGYNDSFQVPHRYGGDEKAPWGLSPEGLRLGLWGVSILGLQLWNSIRVVDFLCSLPDVDPSRIAATGASGGGTQTFVLSAVDERVKVSAPVNMISHYMQGGDLCENGPNLRIDTDNVEIGALAAPRPLLLISATGDWTRDTERVEFPAIQSVYKLLRAEDHVAHQQFPFQHNYNRSSREAVYTFFAQWLAAEPGKTRSARVEERGEFTIDPGRLLVFSRRQPPADAVDPKQLTEYLVSSARGQLEAARPRNAQELESYRRQFGPVFRTALMVEPPSPEDIRWWPAEKSSREFGRERLILSRASVGDRIPAQLLRPAGRAAAVVLLIGPEGADAALGSTRAPSPIARELSKRGLMLFSIDAFQTGEARDPSRKMEGGFFSTYNRTDDVQRVQDILTALVYLEARWKPQKIAVVGQGLAGLWCLLARVFLRNPVPVAADTAGFASASDSAYLEGLHIPLLRRAGDFQTAALLAPASPLLLHNLAGRFAAEAFAQAFELQNASDHLRVSNSELPAAEIASWVAAH